MDLPGFACSTSERLFADEIYDKIFPGILLFLRVVQVILLVDMDAFYAGVHQVENPQLKGKPVLVGGDPSKRSGVVTTASYEARALGVKPPVPLWKAKQVCPQGIFVRADFSLYRRYSHDVISVLRQFTELVEPASIDEAFLDIKDCCSPGAEHLLGEEIKEAVRARTGLSCSVGIGENRLLAKMAADMEKPDGLTVLTKADVPEKMWPLPVRELYGVGAKTSEKLNKMDMFTIGDLAAYPEQQLQSVFGKFGVYMSRAARGEGSTVVDPNPKQPKSIGHQNTLSKNVFNTAELKSVITQQAVSISRRLIKYGLTCHTVRVGIKDSTFNYFTRQKKLTATTRDPVVITAAAVDLIKKNFPKRGVRMIGLTAADLEKNRGHDIDLVFRLIEQKYGPNTVFPASHLVSRERPERR